MSPALLEIRDLQVRFGERDGGLRAVDRATLHVDAGETVGVVGETGCGKSVTALSILGLIPRPPGRIVGGEILFEGKDLLGKSEAEMRRIRGEQIAMIFQEPMTALDPSFTIGGQMYEVLKAHRGLSRAEARREAKAYLERVRMPHPERVLKQYPHQLSGGMRQRVMIAMALSCQPSLLVADEPTTALDVTVQAQILRLLLDLQESTNTAVLLITHDLGVVAETCERAYVMYAGRVVETGLVSEIFSNPLHPYTQGLLAAIPSDDERDELQVIAGDLPNPYEDDAGCRFAPRCPYAMEICTQQRPDDYAASPTHSAACFLMLNPDGDRP